MNSVVIWRGISRLDRKTPIVVVLTGLVHSGNTKTGPMLQTWILVDDKDPRDAIDDGSDVAICGDCPARKQPDGRRDCYVSKATGMSAIARKLGTYPHASLYGAAELVRDRELRIGTYGDPAAVPAAFWKRLTRVASGWTGYTHQWRRFPALRPLCMASVDSAYEMAEAHARGWRTFRVRKVGPLGIEPLARTEVICPASYEADKVATCQDCQLCKGTARRAKDVAIIDHSTSALAKRRLQMYQPTLPFQVAS